MTDAINIERADGEIVSDEPIIICRDVNKWYGDFQALKDISMDVQAQEVLVIIGPSGSGKTTLANLLMRFYDPQEGRILLDGHDLKNLTLHSLRSQIGVVSQEVVLFNDTIRYNISYGSKDAPESELVAAAKAANAHQFIMKMPQGYDTPVGERGVKLSGGERQRVAIARALVVKPKLVIADEPTANLDSENSRMVVELMRKMNRTHKVTFVFTTHDPRLLEHVDRKILLRDGKIENDEVSA